MAASPDDIAIIGMSCRVAGADSPSKLWEILTASKDVQTRIERFNADGFYKPDGGPRKGLTNVRHAYMIEDFDRFDNAFFNISPLEAEAMDPQQRILLEIAYEAVENAGIPLDEFQGSDTAVFAGISVKDYDVSLLRDIDLTPKYHSTGTSNAILANRISYAFDLHGASLSIDTACSSTMVALHQAMATLKANDAQMALVCGANMIISPDMFVHMSELGFLSPQGRCRSFDASGDGYVRGEGVAAILLKPLSAALKNNDPIRAIVKATRINQDGRTQGITMPSGEAQRRNLEALYGQPGLSPDDVQYVEAHGTGTAVGDPIEVGALEAVFGDSHCDEKLVVGSVKSNIGHLESTAALAGIIKTVEALERGKIPPQMHFKNPNPKINFDRIHVPTTTIDWPMTRNGMRRAGVNSFGFGGTNGHAILEHYPSLRPQPDTPASRPYLFKVSAATVTSLKLLANIYADYVEQRQPPLSDLAHTLLARRSTLQQSLLVTATSYQDLVNKLRDGSTKHLTRRNKPIQKVGFIFTGQGAQWPQMGKQLLETSQLFRAVIEACDQTLASLPDGPSWSIFEELMQPKETSRLPKASFSQPICSALQIGLVELWKSWGITPHAVVGHSSGEIGAAYATGLLSLREAIIIAYYRGLYLGENATREQTPGLKGAMCAVGLGEAGCMQLCKKYEGRIALAAVNSPSSCTLSGDADAIKEVVDACAAQGTFCRALRVDMAYHSHHMLPLAPAYEKAMRAASIGQAKNASNVSCAMFSSVTRRQLLQDECTPAYWKENMVSTVRFSDALSDLVRSIGPDAVIEIGPHPALSGPVRDTLASLGKTDILYFSSCFRGKPDLISILESVGEMIPSGMPVISNNINAVELVNGLKCEHGLGRVLTDIPQYQWDHSAVHWGESRVSYNLRHRQFPRHELLGTRSYGDIPLAPSWRNILSIKDINWLNESAGERATASSLTIILMMALEAARQLQATEMLDSSFVALKDIQLIDPLILGDDGIETIFNARQAEGSSKWQFEIFSSSKTSYVGSWTKHCTGEIAFSNQPILQKSSRLDVAHDEELFKYIQSFETVKMPSIAEFELSADCATGCFTSKVDGYEDYHINPNLLASLLNVPEILMLGSGTPAAYRVRALDLLELPSGAWQLYEGSFDASITTRNSLGGRANVSLYQDNRVLIRVDGIHLQVEKLIQRKPQLNSTFFTPKILPDIAHMLESPDLTIAQVIELVTHKWPMSDIGIVNLSPADAVVVSSSLKGLKSEERPRFRSLNVVGDGPTFDSQRVRKLKQASESDKFHLLIGSARDLRSDASHLLHNGVICMRLENDEDEIIFQNGFTKICEVTGFELSGWVLGKLNPSQNGAILPSRLKVFAPSYTNIEPLRESLDFGLVHMDTPSSIATWKNDSSDEKFDVVIFDSDEKSLLIAWSGSDLLTWIQPLLERTRHMLWVSQQQSSGPYGSVAASFLKTVQAEQPSIKVSSLLFEDCRDSLFLSRTVSDVFDSMIHGESELELIVKDGLIHNVRYHPDDALSASVGIIPPIVSDTNLESKSYILSLAGPTNTVVFFERPGISASLPDAKARVKVEVSVVDDMDILSFVTGGNGKEWGGLGHFFAGQIVTSGDVGLPLGTRVVGWHPNAHQNNIEVPLSQLFPIPDTILASDAAVRYAAYTTSLLLISEVARARAGETVKVNVQGILGEALIKVCHELGIKEIDDPSVSPDFVVTFDHGRGLLLNNRPTNATKFIHNDRLRAFARELVTSPSKWKNQVSVFSIQNHQQAFEAAIHAPISVAISHLDTQTVKGAIACRTSPKQLFRSDGAYILIGGLGGLGQHIALWMINNGAKHIITLSRSGLKSPGAQHTVDIIKNLGADIQVIKADATNFKEVGDALAVVRQSAPIRGCINLAMILADSPFSTMTPEQWDLAVQVKVQATWNLHTHTLSDQLDFFIMFSSVSSILGNRTQSNYATANAFLNGMAEYRKSLGLPATAIALGPVGSIGVLANNERLQRTLRQSGLVSVEADDLDKIMEAAILESPFRERPVITNGFQMLENLDGKVQATSEQTQLYWTEYPEFGFLMDHKFNDLASAEISLQEVLRSRQGKDAHQALLRPFLGCLQNIMGQDESTFDPNMPLSQYGLDSLNAVGVRYWFFKQLGVDVPVFDILGSKSINDLLSRMIEKLSDQNSTDNMAVRMPHPKRHEDMSVRPLSHSQRRLWFLNRFLPDKTVYNLLLVCHIEGTADEALLAKTWSVFMQRHEVLRSRIVDTPDGLQQIPIADAQFSLSVINTSEDHFPTAVKELTDMAKNINFDIENGEIIRGWLLRSPAEARFFLASHHLAWDRASVPVIFSETQAIYKSLLAKNDPLATLQPVPYQFIDYTLWEETWLNEEALVKPLIGYWKETLEGIPEAVSLLPLSLIDKRPAVKQYHVGTVTHALGKSLSTAIKEFCKRKAVTPFMFMASAVTALINRLTGDEDVVIGIPDGDRGHSAFDALVGFTVNMLAIRSKFKPDMSYDSFLEEYRVACLKAYEHRVLPFDYLIQQLDVPRQTSHSPVFQVTINYQVHGSFAESDFDGFKFTKYDHYNAKTQSDFALEIEETSSGELVCSWDFDEALYDEARMSDLAATYRVFVDNIISKDGNAKLDELQLISETDLAMIASNLQPSYKSERSLADLNNNLFPTLFARSVAQYPHKLALIDDTGSHTYTELERRTNAIANRLIQAGVKVGDSIGICCEQGRELLVGIYGILKAGCAYVPIDPDFPAERVLSMIEDASVQIVLVENTTDVKCQRILACGISLPNVFVTNEIATVPGANTMTPILSRPISHLDPFCCIFTSGSTGRPKGIFLNHGQLRYEMEGYNRYISTVPEDQILLSSAVVFDMCLPALYGTIQYGATLFVASREARYSPAKMVDSVIDHKISSCIFTPTQAKMLLNAPNKSRLLEWADLHAFVLGGETIPPWFVRDFYRLNLPHAKLFNGYAPSETTVVNTLRHITIEDAQRPGMPLEGPFFPARFHILDRNMQPVPFGIPGELYIAGPNVSKGYVNRPDVTARAFMKDPFAPASEIETGCGHLYRTGDSFRLNRDGTVDILGRIGGDRQVKIRGMRTELEEIENAIWEAYEASDDDSISKLSLVAVVYHRTKGSDGILAAYLAPQDRIPVSAEKQRQLTEYLRLSLKAVLPPHMLPATYVFMDDLPCTVSGKVDYKTITGWPAPEVIAGNGTDSQGKPLTELQAVVASIWKEILSISGDLSSTDEFFTLGGHSLALVQLQQKIQDACGATLSLADMFAYPSIAGFEELIMRDPRYRASNSSSQMNGVVKHETSIDWEKEGSLPEGATWYIESYTPKAPSVLVVTGATGMIGAHFIQLILTTTTSQVHCIGVNTPDGGDPRQAVLSALSRWNLASNIPSNAYDRLTVYQGNLSDPTLGLTSEQISYLDSTADAIYHFDSEVSMLKNYEAIRAGNVGCLQFLVDLARGPTSNNVKAFHYLSTWGVPHLQTWHTTELTSPGYLTGEEEMVNMKPGPESMLGYLKCRWACESILYQAARRGLPVNIYRSCMVGTNKSSQQGLDQTDINRRIIDASLQTGLVPDFNSRQGGGMSWIELDFLVRSIKFLSGRQDQQQQQTMKGDNGRQATIFNLVSDQHILYSDMAALLGESHGGEKLRVVEPKEWIQALRAINNPGIAMHAEVLAQWNEAGWVAIQLQADETLRLLREEAGLVPPRIDRAFMLERVVGKEF